METGQSSTYENLGSFSKQDVIDLDKQGIDLILLKKVVKQLILEEKNLINDSLKQEFEGKFFALNSQSKTLTNKLSQLQDLINLSQQSYGKSLTDALKDYTMDIGMQPKLQELRDDLLSKQEFKDELTNNYVKNDDLERAKNELQKTIDNLIIKLSDMDSQKRQVNNDLTYMKSMVTDKVDAKDIRMLEKKVESCAPWESVRNVYKELSFYLKKDDFELNKADNHAHLKKMQQQIDTLISKQEAMKEISQLRAQIYTDLEKFARVKDVQNDRIDYGKMFQKLNDTNNDFRKSFAKLENDLVNLRRAMEKKANEDDLKETQKSLNHYAEKEDLFILQRKVIPKIDEFDKRLIFFTQQAETHDEIIRRYDEIISDKASKWNIQELSAEMNNNFAKLLQMNNLQQSILGIKAELQRLIQDSEDKFETLNKQISQEIILAVKKVQKQQGGANRMSSLQGVGGSSGVTVNFEEMKQLLNMKANTAELNQIMELKSNKTDTEQLMSSQSILSRQIKHLLVMFMEFIKLSINETMDTKMTVENKKKFILNQLKALARWILRFDPGQQNSTAGNIDGFEGDFMLGEESKALQDFTDQILGESIYQPNQSAQKLPMSFQNLNIKKSRDRHYMF